MQKTFKLQVTLKVKGDPSNPKVREFVKAALHRAAEKIVTTIEVIEPDKIPVHVVEVTKHYGTGA